MFYSTLSLSRFGRADIEVSDGSFINKYLIHLLNCHPLCSNAATAAAVCACSVATCLFLAYTEVSEPIWHSSRCSPAESR